MRLLGLFNTHLDSRPLQLPNWFSYFFVLSCFQPLERRCSLTKGVRETDIFGLDFLCPIYSGTLWKHLLETRLNFESRASNDHYSRHQPIEKKMAWNTNSVWENVFASTYRYWKATIKYCYHWRERWRSGESVRLPLSCGTGSIPPSYFVSWLSRCFQIFFPWFSSFPPSTKTNISK